MTIASTRTQELDIGQIVLMGYRKAGLLNEHQDASETKLSAGKMLLETIIKELQVYGVQARAVVLETVSVTAGTNTISLASTTFDVLGSAVHIDGDDNQNNPTTILPMMQMDRERRQTVTSQAAQGVPTLFYVDRTVTPLSVYLWPTPKEDCFIRFQVHRLAADNFDTTKTPDLERYWAQYLIWELGHQLAVDNSLAMDRVIHLASQAKLKLQMAKSYAAPRGATQLVIDHPTPWTR